MARKADNRPAIKKKLHSLGVGSEIQIADYRWRKLTLGGPGTGANWVRTDDERAMRTTTQLIDLILEAGEGRTKVIARKGEVELGDKKPYSPRRTLAERTRDEAQARMNAIDDSLERLVARQEKLIAEKKELSNLLASINKHCPLPPAEPVKEEEV